MCYHDFLWVWLHRALGHDKIKVHSYHPSLTVMVKMRNSTVKIISGSEITLSRILPPHHASGDWCESSFYPFLFILHHHLVPLVSRHGSSSLHSTLSVDFSARIGRCDTRQRNHTSCVSNSRGSTNWLDTECFSQGRRWAFWVKTLLFSFHRNRFFLCLLQVQWYCNICFSRLASYRTYPELILHSMLKSL